MNSFKVISPGSSTTVQDLGRRGYQAYGIPPSGVMDDFSARLANLLVGASEDQALLEASLLGPELIFNCQETISITGADMGPRINSRPIALWTSYQVKEGDILSFTGLKSGLRCYIAFSRGLDIKEVLGSKSTYRRAGLGGYRGRALKKGDLLLLKNCPPEKRGRSLGPGLIPDFDEKRRLRLILGPQDDYFNKEAIKLFLSSSYEISPESDSMGYRLKGPVIPHLGGADIISDGVAPGSIQIPGEGQPIIMLADRQTTGGYTKLATLIKEDIAYLAQKRPGEKLSFRALDIEEAHRLYRAYEEKIVKIKNYLEENIFDFSSRKNFNIYLNKKTYYVELLETK